MIPIITPQLGAFLQGVLRACEGTAGTDEGYRALFGWRPGNGRTFDSFADHPRQFFPYTQKDGTVVQTSAAGAWQITATTWDDFCRNEGKHDFSPSSQQACAAWLVWKCGALEDVEAGRLLEAMQKCAGRWASLPTSTAPQPHRDYQFCRAAFIAAGGLIEKPAMKEPPSLVITPQPDFPTVGGADNSNAVSSGPTLNTDAADLSDPSVNLTPAPPTTGASAMGAVALPLLAQLIPQILTLFSGRAQADIQAKTGADASTSQQFMQALIGMVGQAVGQPITGDASAIAATAALQKKVADLQAAQQQDQAAQADLVKKLEDQALDYLHQLTDAGAAMVAIRRDEVAIDTASANAAVARFPGESWDMTMLLVIGALATGAFLVVFVCGVAGYQIVMKDGAAVEVWAAVTGLIGFATGVLGTIYAFRFGSSRSSGAKDVILGGIAAHNQSKGA